MVSFPKKFVSGTTHYHQGHLRFSSLRVLYYKRLHGPHVVHYAVYTCLLLLVTISGRPGAEVSVPSPGLDHLNLNENGIGSEWAGMLAILQDTVLGQHRALANLNLSRNITG